MGEAVVLHGGAGGLDSSDVTAKREHVLQGYTALTADSNDDPAEGTMQRQGAYTTPASMVTDSNQMYIRIPMGAYLVPTTAGLPEVNIPLATLANLLGVDPAKMLKTLTVAGKQGQIEDRGSYIDGDGVWYYGDGGFMVSQIPPGYYGGGNGSGKTNVNTKRESIVAALGLNPDFWLDNSSIMGIQGRVPRWVCTTGDIISAWNGEGHAYDDPYAGRGRGIVVRLADGHRIEKASWVFLPSPNLQPWNIRENVNINNVVGTMKDYSVGRVVFNGATFDGTLALGVADKGFDYNGTYYARRYLDNYAYTGIWGGGINFYMSTAMTAVRGRYIGCALTASINLTPFSRIVIDYRAQGTIQNNPYIALKVFISRASAIIRNHSTTPEGWKIDDLGVVLAEGSNAASQNGGQMTIDVRGVNEHAFIAFGAMADIAGSNSNLFAGSMQITKIEFFN